jgi:pimeloyl-ACP methyl ester carboxylesterase
MTTALIVLGLLVIGAAGILLALSPGRPTPLRDKAGAAIPGSLSERIFVEINGVRQGMFIQSADVSNPVLLFLHGGPGMPQFVFTDTHPTPLAHDFTVVWWEQRGAGLSFDPNIPPESMTLEQMIADAIAVTDHLRARFGQDRIYLLGHSWGSFLGIQVAAAAPERFHAYVGMAQVAHQLRSEALAYQAMLDAYQVRGDTTMVRRLEAAPVSMQKGLSDAYMRLRDAAMHGLGAGTTHEMRSVVTGLFLPVWRSRAYTLTEKVNIWRGLAFSRRHLWDRFLRTDLTRQVTRLDLPVYFLVGRHDLTANPALSRDYFDRIEAPLKGFYTFAASAHSPLFEEPQRALDILLEDVAQGRVELADRS